MIETLRRDRARYEDGRIPSAGFFVVAVYRFGMWAHSQSNVLLRSSMWLLYRLGRLPFAFLHVHLWAGKRGARLGAGFVLRHPTNVMIGEGVEIGENCRIFHDVTLGTGPIPGTPKIGNNVDIYVGARILGGVTIGDNCMVGANCVVMRDVPANSVVMAPACRVISRSLTQYTRAGPTQDAPAPSAGPAAEGG